MIKFVLHCIEVYGIESACRSIFSDCLRAHWLLDDLIVIRDLLTVDRLKKGPSLRMTLQRMKHLLHGYLVGANGRVYEPFE